MNMQQRALRAEDRGRGSSDRSVLDDAHRWLRASPTRGDPAFTITAFAITLGSSAVASADVPPADTSAGEKKPDAVETKTDDAENKADDAKKGDAKSDKNEEKSGNCSVTTQSDAMLGSDRPGVDHVLVDDLAPAQDRQQLRAGELVR